MNKNSQMHFYVETEVLKILKLQASQQGITLSKLCREKLRDYSLLARLQGTLDNIDHKISKEEKILNLLKLSLKSQFDKKREKLNPQINPN
jgi:hypothetical protein